MKKEHWLYVIIAILVIWIIASYISAPKTEAPSSTDNADNNNSIGDYSDSDTGSVKPNDSDGTSGGIGSTQTSSGPTITNNGVIEAGMMAGPNKGIVISPLAPKVASVNTVDQKAGMMVGLGTVEMPVSGWVVIHEDNNGVPGNILGAQRFDAGVYTGGQVEIYRSTVTGKSYYAMILTDDGDRMFDYKLDTTHQKDINGRDAISTFIAL